MGVGILAGVSSSVLIPEFLKNSGGWISSFVSEKLHDYFGIGELEESIDKAIDHLNENGLADSSAGNGEGIADVATEAAELHGDNNIDLVIPKGSSFEGAIIDHLKETGMDSQEAGKQAHLMYLDYIKDNPDVTGHDYNLVHPNAHLELSPDGKNILNFEDSPKKMWDVEPSSIIEETPEAKNISAKDIGTENTDSVSGSEREAATNDLNRSDEYTQANVSAMAGTAGIIGGATAFKKATEKKNDEKIIDFSERKEFKKLIKKYEFQAGENFTARARKAINKISNNKVDNWRNVKNAEMDTFISEDGIVRLGLIKNVKNLEKEFIKLLGASAKHRKEEKVREWLARIVNSSISAEEIKQKQAA